MSPKRIVTMDLKSTVVVVLLVGSVFLTGVLTSSGDGGTQTDSTSTEHDDVNAQGIEETIADLFNNSRSKFLAALTNLSSYLPLNVKYAMTDGQKCDIIKYNRPYYSNIPLILAAVVIVLGAIFTFFGYRLMKLVLFLIGFLVGGAVTYFIIIAFTRDRPETWLPYVAIGGAVVIGILCGLLTICVYYIGLFLAGGSVGFLILWFILAAIDVDFFHTHIYVPIIIAIVGGIVAGVITLLIQKWFFMFGITVLGSFLIIWGLDYYLELGSIIYYLFLFAEHRAKFKPCWYSWSIIPLFVVLFVSGFLIQALLTGRKYDHKKEFNGVCCGLCKKKKKTKTVDGSGKYMELKNTD